MPLKSLLQSITKKQWQFVLLISLIAIIITSLPTLYGYFFNPEGFQLSGLHALTPGDTNVYFSYINQIKNGNYLLRDQFTTEPQFLKIFNLFWLFSGLISKFLNFSSLFTFHLIRIVLIPIIVLSAYLLLSYFFQNIKKRQVTLVFLLFSSGLGVYFNNLNQILPTIYKRPLDLWMPEATFFNTILHSPHFIAASLLILLTFLFFLLAIENNNYRYSIFAGICSLFLFNFHPYHFPLIYLTTLIYLIILIKEKSLSIKTALKHYLIILFISLSSILYHLYTLKDPIYSARGLQNVTLTPPFVCLILGFGFFLFLGLFGLIKYFEKYDSAQKKYLFLGLWLLISLCLAYLPTWQFQRRSLQTIQFPLIIFSIEALWYFKEKIKIKNKLLTSPFIIAIIFILFFSPTSLYNLCRDFYLYQIRHPYMYLSTSEIQAFDWLDSRPEQNILTDHSTGNYLPAYTHKNVFYGHGHETLFSQLKKDWLNQVFTNQLPDQAIIKTLQAHKINYLYWNQVSQTLYPKFRPDTKPYLQQQYHRQDIQIYRVIIR